MKTRVGWIPAISFWEEAQWAGKGVSIQEQGRTVIIQMPCMHIAKARKVLRRKLSGFFNSRMTATAPAIIVYPKSLCTMASQYSCFLWSSIRKPSMPKAIARKTCGTRRVTWHNNKTLDLQGSREGLAAMSMESYLVSNAEESIDLPL